MYNKIFQQKYSRILLFVLWIIFGFILNIILWFYNKDADYTFANINWCGVDSDQDWVIDILEDTNHDWNLFDDDTDYDGIPNFLDKDDDNDWIFTLFEDINHNWNPFDDDTDHDSIPNYLDSDDNNDWVGNLDKILKLNNISKEFRNDLIKDITDWNNPQKLSRLQEYLKYISISTDWDTIPDYLQNYKDPKKNNYELFDSYLWRINYISSDYSILWKYSDRIVYYIWQDKYTYNNFVWTWWFLYKPDILDIWGIWWYKTWWKFYILQNNDSWYNLPNWSIWSWINTSIQEIYKYIYEYIYTWNGFNNFFNNSISNTGQTIIYIYTWNTWLSNYQNNNWWGTTYNPTNWNYSGNQGNSSTWNELKPYADYYRCSNPFWWTPIEHGKSVFAYQYSSVDYPNTCKWENRVCNNGTLGWSFIEKICIQVWDNCQTPWWTIIKHWQTIKTYSLNTVSFSEWCDSVSVTRQCLDWVLWWAANGKFQNCEEQKARICIWPDGNSYSHNQIATYYKYPKVIWELKDWEDVCPRQARRCYDWSWYDLDLTKKLTFTYSNPECVAVVK